MKVENNFKQVNIPQIKAKNVKPKQQNFTGAFDTFLRFLDTNQAWGANFVDVAFMVAPRTGTDFIERNSSAGWETARRESMGTINDSSVGLYGAAAGLALASGINKTYNLGDRDLKVSSIFADSETIDMMGEVWHKKLDNSIKDPLLERIKLTLGNYEVLKDGKWVRFNEEDINDAAKIIRHELEFNEKMGSDAAYDAQKILTSSHSLENGYRIISKEAGKVHNSRYNLESIIENTFKLSKLFTKEKIAQVFEEAKEPINNAFLKSLKSMNLKRSLGGVAIATLVGCSTQPINMWLTKRKTGVDGFVGGGEKDNSFKFKMEKLGVSLLFGAGVLASIGNPKHLIKNLQFKGFSPTINQLKFIYGLTIISRFFASRNENELKEASTKDILGFTNWLILGNFVQKLVAQSLDKSLVKQEKLGGILNWITTTSLKTRDEVLAESLGKSAFKNKKALSFSEMLKAIKNNPVAKRRIGILTFAQLMGYTYSGLVLGIGIPRLNIYLTNRRMAKQAAQKQNNLSVQIPNINSDFKNQFSGHKLIERMEA